MKGLVDVLFGLNFVAWLLARMAQEVGYGTATLATAVRFGEVYGSEVFGYLVSLNAPCVFLSTHDLQPNQGQVQQKMIGHIVHLREQIWH